MHFDFLLGEADGKRSRSPHSGTIDGKRVLEFGSPDLVLLDLRHRHAVGVMHGETARWALLYRDNIAELWGRRERYDDPASQDYFPLAARALESPPRTGNVPWPALPAPGRGLQLVAGEGAPRGQGSDHDGT